MPYDQRSMELHGLFKTLAKKVTEEWSKRVDTGLSLPHFRMLYILQTHGQQKVAELAEQLHVTSGAITGMSDKLIEKGLVDRKRDIDDRRVVYLYITDEGKTLMDTLIEKQRTLYGNIVDRLADEDVEHMKRILSQMIHLLDSIDKE